jgi:hypothetical protein
MVAQCIVGSGVRLFGATSPSSAPCAFNATVDGKSTQSTPKNATILAEFSSLKFGNHDMAVNVSCPGEESLSSVFRFDFAEFDAGVVNGTVLDDGNSVRPDAVLVLGVFSHLSFRLSVTMVTGHITRTLPRLASLMIRK